MERRRITPLLIAAGALWLAAVTVQAAPQMASGDEPMKLDTDICAACHDDVVGSFGGPHAALARDGAHGDIQISCQACHGDPTAHLEAGGGKETIRTFDESNGALANSKVCLSCHANTHPDFLRSPHAQAGLACQSCHSIHKPAKGSWLMLKSTAPQRPMENLSEASRVCQQCHGEVFDQFSFNERHRLQEGVLGCESCHDPHASATRARLGGFKQEACVKCHADKGGPFVFEHGSVRVEGCVACHTPHGSPNRHLLKFQKVAELCFSCHGEVPSFHSRFTLDTTCTQCHSSIHGSNFSPFFLK